MRCESANFIEARSGSTGCNKVGYRAAAHPVCLNTRKTGANGTRSYSQRMIFTQPEISIGYLGNPPLSPLVDVAQDLILVLANPLVRQHMPPRNARDILDRLNEI